MTSKECRWLAVTTDLTGAPARIMTAPRGPAPAPGAPGGVQRLSHHPRPAVAATGGSSVVGRRRRLGGAPVPSVELRVVACVPRFAQPGLAQIPVGADLAGHGP